MKLPKFLLPLIISIISIIFSEAFHAHALPEGAIMRLGKGFIGSGDRAVQFSPDGNTLAVASSIGVWLYDTQTLKEIRLLEGHTSGVNSVFFSPDGKTLASGSGNTVILWDAMTGNILRRLEGHKGYVTSVSFSPDGKTIASGSKDNTVILWDVMAGNILRRLEGHEDSVFSVSFSPDGKTLASGSRGKTVILWDAMTGNILRTLVGHGGSVFSISFSPDGKILASGSRDNTIILWDAMTGNILRRLVGHKDEVHSVSFSPDGKTVASGSDDDSVILWDAMTGNILHRLVGHKSLLFSSVSFSSDGKTLASGGWDNTVILWDTMTGNILRRLEGHEDWCRSVSFSPDGKTVASGSSDKTVILWDAMTGNILRTFVGHKSDVFSVSFSPDGKTVASGSGDGTVLIWSVPPTTGPEPEKPPKFLTLPFRDSDIKIQQGWVYTFDPNPDAHKGIDYIKGAIDQSSTWQSFDVVAAADGVAMQSSGGGYGTFVYIQHNEKDSARTNYFTLYAHLDSVDAKIVSKPREDTNYSTWTPVKRGEVIGRAGATGVVDHPTWVHLHFEVQIGGYTQNKTDPYDLYKIRDFYPGGVKYAGSGPKYLWTTDPPISPSKIKVTPSIVNNQVVVSLAIENAESLRGYAVDLEYSPALELLESKPGAFLPDNWKSSPAGANTLRLSASKKEGESVKGSGEIATLTFRIWEGGELSFVLKNGLMTSASGETFVPAIEGEKITVVASPDWDINKDYVVDISDLVILGAHFGEKVTGKPRPNPDITRDGQVDIQDFMQVKTHFGEEYSAVPKPASPGP
jgi:WD40 repeat protein